MRAPLTNATVHPRTSISLSSATLQEAFFETFFIMLTLGVLLVVGVNVGLVVLLNSKYLTLATWFGRARLAWAPTSGGT